MPWTNTTTSRGSLGRAVAQPPIAIGGEEQSEQAEASGHGGPYGRAAGPVWYKRTSHRRTAPAASSTSVPRSRRSSHSRSSRSARWLDRTIEPAAVAERRQQVERGAGRLDVERAERLVHQQHGRRAAERRRELGLACHPGRVSPSQGVPSLVEADGVEQGARAARAPGRPRRRARARSTPASPSPSGTPAGRADRGRRRPTRGTRGACRGRRRRRGGRCRSSARSGPREPARASTFPTRSGRPGRSRSPVANVWLSSRMTTGPNKYRLVTSLHDERAPTSGVDGEQRGEVRREHGGSGYGRRG